MIIMYFGVVVVDVDQYAYNDDVLMMMDGDVSFGDDADTLMMMGMTVMLVIMVVIIMMAMVMNMTDC